MSLNRLWDKVWTIETAAFAVLALYCVVQHLFAYNYAVGNVAYIPLLLGSYIYMTYMVAAAFLPHMALRQHSRQVTKELTIVAVFFALAILVVFLCDDQVRIYRDFMGRSVMQYNLRCLAGHSLAFVVGFSLTRLGRFKPLIVAGFVLLAANALINVDFKTMLINLDIKDEESKGIYLMLGDTFGLWAMLTCAVVEGRRSRVILVTIAVVCLAVLNSRTSLYAFLVTIPFVFRMNKVRSVVIIAVAAAIVMAISSLLAGQEGLVDRMFDSVISGRDGSTKWRIIQFEAGLQGLADHWILGDYAGQVRDFGDIGAYMHNILSYWRQFGLLPFLLVLILWGKAIQRARRYYCSDEAWADPDVRFFVMAVVFFGIEVLTSRSYGYPHQWLVFGQSAALLGRQLWRTKTQAKNTKLGAMALDFSAWRDLTSHSKAFVDGRAASNIATDLAARDRRQVG